MTFRATTRGTGSVCILGFGFTLPWERNCYGDSQVLSVSVYLFRWKLQWIIWMEEYPDLLDSRNTLTKGA